MALLVAALSSKGWRNRLFHFAILEAVMPNFFLRAGYRCVCICVYRYVYICIHKSSEFADRLPAGDYKAVPSSGEACIRLLSVKCLGLEFSYDYENTLPVPCITPIFVRSHASKQIPIAGITGNRDNNSYSLSCHF